MAKKKSSTGKPVPAPKRPMVKVKKPSADRVFTGRDGKLWRCVDGVEVPVNTEPEKPIVRRVRPSVCINKFSDIYDPNKEVSLDRYVMMYLSTDPHDGDGVIERTKYELEKLQVSYTRLLAVLHEKHIISVADIKKIVGGC